jgi:SAM-dependent methyltransferase
MTIANSDQAEYWNSDSGRAWATHQEKLDTLLAGTLDVLLDCAAPLPGEKVLDIGCGTGASSMALSELVGEQGHVTALDISEPLLTLARHRAGDCSNLDFVHGDAQIYPFAADSADLVISRFGVMFFDNPVAAFANLNRAARPGGRLVMACWQGAPENPWFMLPMQAAMARLGKPEQMDPHTPGPMAFKDVDRVTGILHDAGWHNPKGELTEVDLIPPLPLKEAANFAATFGPATRLLREKNGSEEDAEAIRAATASALAPFQDETGLRIPGRIILYTANSPG